MPDIDGINYNGVKPRPTFEEFINVVDYPIKNPDRKHICIGFTALNPT